ncbi:MAG: SDR family oxidoreductase [Proteobacteria bacterium]|jgi:3-oxoacyl-[acyl-carrier protein] reductase|nr:SDR family oxidoreductase [Pseudomonadota bacterium]
MDLGLEGRKAIVCGASRGLGFAAARALVREGARVAVVARGASALEAAAGELEREGGPRPFAVAADLVVPGDRERAVREARAALGGVDALVLNTGGPPPGPFESHGIENWHLAIELALVSAAHLAALVLPEMRERRFGRIAQIVSIAGLEAVDGLILSNASRPAALGFAKALAREVAGDGVLVNSVCPGVFLTDRIRELALERARSRGITEDAFLAEFCGDIPIGRPGDPSEVGDLLAFLCSPRNTYITGAAIPIDGGKTRRLY